MRCYKCNSDKINIPTSDTNIFCNLILNRHTYFRNLQSFFFFFSFLVLLLYFGYSSGKVPRLIACKVTIYEVDFLQF